MGTIVITAVVVSMSFSALGGHGPSWNTERGRIESFTAHRFALVWNDPAARDQLAAELATDLDLDLALRDDGGHSLGIFGPHGRLDALPCARPSFRVHVPAGASGGELAVCTTRHGGAMSPERLALVLLTAWMVLWMAAGRLARRLTRPLTELVATVQDIGQGRLDRRVRLGPHDPDEVGVLARVVNDMAERIERQVQRQRELLAAVSHEIRSPLARLRFMLELLRDGGAQSTTVDEMDHEVEGIDALVGDLLATSRMDFNAVNRVSLDAATVARRAMEQSKVDPVLLDAGVEAIPFEGDATLLHTALGNLLGNAIKHGGRVTAVRVARDGATVRFAVEDDGPGFATGEETRAFEPFYRGDGARRDKRAGVGLGLALVRRIAEVHGGSAFVERRDEGGARVVFTVRAT